MYYLSVKDVSNKLGLDQPTVQKMCEKGKFHNAYQTDNGDWLISEDNFVTTKEQDEKADEILRQIDIKNNEADVGYIDITKVADYFDVSLKKVIEWIEQGRLSGKKIEGDYKVPLEEFEFLKSKRENDTTEEVIKERLGSDYDDWEIEIDE